MAKKESPAQILSRLRAGKLLRIQDRCVQFVGGSRKEGEDFSHACQQLKAHPGTYHAGTGRQFTFTDPKVFAEVFPQK
jgi:hypothetical protein